MKRTHEATELDTFDAQIKKVRTRPPLPPSLLSPLTLSASQDSRVFKEMHDAGIDNEDLLDNLLHHRPTGVADSVKESALGVLCHVFFDLLEKDQPPAPTLKEFLGTYKNLLESKDTVEVFTRVKTASKKRGSVDHDLHEHEHELMPKMAVEYLDLVNPSEDLGDGYMWNWYRLQNEFKPVWISIAPEEWLTSRVGGRWRECITTAADDGASYTYFVKHYKDADRDARTLAIWNLMDDDEEEEDK